MEIPEPRREPRSIQNIRKSALRMAEAAEEMVIRPMTHLSREELHAAIQDLSMASIALSLAAQEMERYGVTNLPLPPPSVVR